MTPTTPTPSDASVAPMPHDRYKVEAFSIGEEGDWIVFGTHDAAAAAAMVRPLKHGQECWQTDPLTCEECVWQPEHGEPSWFRQRPGRPDEEWAWFLVRAQGPSAGVRPAVYFRG